MVEWDEAAESAITALVARENAVSRLEIEAKLADRPGALVEGQYRAIQPHVLNAARIRLLNANILSELTEYTRGGRTIPLYVPGNAARRRTRIARAAARKRLLMTRFYGWGQATDRQPNLIGRAGEQVTHQSLLTAAAAGTGYNIVRPEGGEVRQLLGNPVPGGPLDDAAFLAILDNHGRPTGLPTLVAIEVKNIRQWIYPISKELHELLDKTAQLQSANPDQPILPVLVCRRAHKSAFWMAKQLGFFILEARTQFILPHSSLDSTHLAEVQEELAFTDLGTQSGPHDRITRYFRDELRGTAYEASVRWAQTAPILASYYEAIRRGNNPIGAMNDLQEAAAQFDSYIGW